MTVTGARLPGKAKRTVTESDKYVAKRISKEKGEVAGRLWHMEFKLGPRIHGLQLAISAV